MDPKVILVIALLGVASLDWLASAEQDDESPNRTLDEAKYALTDSSLTPEQVTKILEGLEGHWKIDGFYVSSLLWWLKKFKPCPIWAQEYRERTCNHLRTLSVKKFCNHVVKQSRDYCQAHPVLALEKNFQIKRSLVNLMSEMEAARRGQGVNKFNKQWVAGLRKSRKLLLKEQCGQFLSAEKKMARLFGIDVGKVARGLHEGHRLKYLQYANIHCKTIVELIKSASKETASELTLGEAKRTLSDPSLKPAEVGQILARLDEDLQIDGVRVGQLLWPNRILRCDVQHQEQREKSCHVIETPSLKKYCESLVERVKDYCKTHPEEALAIYVKYDLKDIMTKSRPAVQEAKAAARSLADVIYVSVDRLKSDELYLSERKCRTFGEQMKQSFGIELNAVRGVPREDQLRYAIAYCETVMEVSKKRRIRGKPKNTKPENERRHKSTFKKVKELFGRS
jgi:hypothetical protein